MPHRNCIHGKDSLQIPIVSEKLQRKMVSITTLARVTAWLRIPSLWAAIQMGPAFMGSWIWRAMCLNGSPMGIKGIITDFHRLGIPLNLKMAPTKSCGGEPGRPGIKACVNSYGLQPGSVSNPITKPTPTLASTAPGRRNQGSLQRSPNPLQALLSDGYLLEESYQRPAAILRAVRAVGQLMRDGACTHNAV